MSRLTMNGYFPGNLLDDCRSGLIGLLVIEAVKRLVLMNDRFRDQFMIPLVSDVGRC